MQKISTVVESIIKKEPIYLESLSLKIVNYRSLAREIQPKVEQIRLLNTSIESISISLIRLEKQLSTKPKAVIPPVLGISFLRNIEVITYHKSAKGIQNYQKILNYSEVKNSFLHFEQSSRDTSYIFSSELRQKIESVNKNETINGHFKKCAIVTIQMHRKSLNYPGACERYFRILAFKNINLITFFHTFAELSFVIKEKDLKKAAQVLELY